MRSAAQPALKWASLSLSASTGAAERRDRHCRSCCSSRGHCSSAGLLDVRVHAGNNWSWSTTGPGCDIVLRKRRVDLNKGSLYRQWRIHAQMCVTCWHPVGCRWAVWRSRGRFLPRDCRHRGVEPVQQVTDGQRAAGWTLRVVRRSRGIQLPQPGRWHCGGGAAGLEMMDGDIS